MLKEKLIVVVAIDGPAGAGKSTIAKKLAAELGLFYLNSGSMYRGITFLCLEKGIEPGDVTGVCRLARDAGISFREDGLYAVERHLEPLLRTDLVESRVSAFAAIPELRDELGLIMKSLAARGDVVVEGRDMTTRVFPDAQFKFYLDADLDARSLRRLNQGTTGLTLEATKKSMQDRDMADTSRKIGRLELSPEAQYIDTTGLTIDQVCAKVVQSIQGHTLRQENQNGHGR